MIPAERASETLARMQKNVERVFTHYLDFTKQIGQYGPLDPKTQELVLTACAVMSQCAECISLHVQGAASLGASKEEILQAAMLAIAMGGSPKMMQMGNVFDEIEDLFD